jgi:hypothetical protein
VRVVKTTSAPRPAACMRRRYRSASRSARASTPFPGTDHCTSGAYHHARGYSEPPMLCRGAIDPAFVGMIRKPSSLTESGSFEGVFSVNTEELQGITLFRREATYQMTFPILANLLYNTKGLPDSQQNHHTTASGVDCDRGRRAVQRSGSAAGLWARTLGGVRVWHARADLLGVCACRVSAFVLTRCRAPAAFAAVDWGGVEARTPERARGVAAQERWAFYPRASTSPTRSARRLASE